MEIINKFFRDINRAEYKFLKHDEAYQTVKSARDEVEENLRSALTRKQRLLFNQYCEQQEALTILELHRLFARCSILLIPKAE